MVKSADGNSFTITVSNVGELKDKKAEDRKADEQLGQIYILWAKESGVSKIKTATITLATGGAQKPITVTIDPTTDTLTIPVSDDKTMIYLWDIVKIDLA